MKVLHITRTLPQEMLGPMYLSRAVKDAGHDMKCVSLPDPKWLTKIKEYAPDVITWSVLTGNHLPIYDLNRLLKSKFQFFSLMGGPHVTFLPDAVKDPDIDAVCVGEGEGAIVDLLNALEKGEDWRTIENLVWCEDGETLHKNPLRPLVRDLDALGFPDRSVIYEANDIYRDSPRKVIVSQRGCPMMCTFCFHHAWKEKVYKAKNSEYVRKRSVDHVIAEALDIKSKYPLDFVHFVDDIFNISGKWLTEFCERWPKEVGLPFDVILMANMTNENHIIQLKAAGCIYARIAFEAANDHMRNTIYKKNTQREQLVNVSGWIKKHGIRLGSLNMLGGPGGTVEEDMDTVRLNIECKVDHPLCSIVQPYPEFEINQITKDMGIAVAEYDNFPTQFNREGTIEIKDKAAIENLHKWFPILVRNPSLMPVAIWTLHKRWLKMPLLWMYMMYSEWLVTEQNTLYNRAQGNRGPLTWAPIDFTLRVARKGIIRVLSLAGAKVVSKMALRLQMGDERVVAHMD
ncbi:MAG: B12-binding domain-containing radical SAM protein [Planctomycetes bacterium]|nr:B12-binding domain-containing radical SAM protein [Planctomycetota bacterium]MCB9912468.1 B12-binding domain-containing radical SAM protein [Planctomycetota bacterium]